MRYVDDLGTLRTASSEQLKAIDERVERVRIPSAALDAVIGLMGSAVLLERNTVSLEKTMKRFGLWRDIRLAQTMLHKVVDALLSKISMRQALSLHANCKSLNVQCSARPATMCVNLPAASCDILVNYALTFCQTQCLRSSQEARDCPLRDVLASIPGMDQDDSGVGICPFMCGNCGEKQ